MQLSRTLLVILAAAALVAAAAGCGSDSSSSDDGTTSASKPAQAPAGGTTTTTPEEKPAQGSKPKDGGSDESDQAPASKEQEIATATAEENKSADQSIQEYGDEAGESEEEELVAAMRNFVKDFSNEDYAAICNDLSADTRAQFDALIKAQKSDFKDLSCPEFLSKLIQSPEKAKAQRILDGVVTNVRLNDENAFVLVKPKGEKVSYFVFNREDDEWKPTSLALGSPLLP